MGGGGKKSNGGKKGEKKQTGSRERDHRPSPQGNSLLNRGHSGRLGGGGEGAIKMKKSIFSSNKKPNIYDSEGGGTCQKNTERRYHIVVLVGVQRKQLYTRNRRKPWEGGETRALEKKTGKARGKERVKHRTSI